MCYDFKLKNLLLNLKKYNPEISDVDITDLISVFFISDCVNIFFQTV